MSMVIVPVVKALNGAYSTGHTFRGDDAQDLLRKALVDSGSPKTDAVLSTTGVVATEKPGQRAIVSNIRRC
jgi:hypothetical protein